MRRRDEDRGVSSPAFPLRVEIAAYRRPGEPGHSDTPFTRDDLERECGDRICLARVTLDDSDKRRASVFITAILNRGGIVLEINQDQTAFGPGEIESNVKRREFKLRFFKGYRPDNPVNQ